MERLDRYHLGALCPETMNAVMDLASLRKKNPGKPVVGTYDFVPQISTLYECMLPTVTSQKVFFITNKTLRRIRNMNIDAFLGPNNDAVKMVFTKDECAYLAWHPEDETFGMCSAAYCVHEGELYVKVFAGEYIAGYIIPDLTDGHKICLLPYSVFSMCTHKQWPGDELHKQVEDMLSLVKQDFPDGTFPTDIAKLAKRKNFAKMKTHDMIEDHIRFGNMLCDALQAIIFMKTSEVYSQEYVPDPTPTYKRKKGYRPLGYICVDSVWDKDIDVNTPFPVRGHFVHQPCKVDGEWTRKLIYVESYMKKGYHRKATKTRHGQA